MTSDLIGTRVRISCQDDSEDRYVHDYTGIIRGVYLVDDMSPHAIVELDANGTLWPIYCGYLIVTRPTS